MAKVAEKPVRAERKRLTDTEGRLLFTYQDLLQMEEKGLIHEDEHLELLGGKLYVMTIKPPHAMVVGRASQKMGAVFDERAFVLSQNPLRISDNFNDTELPQPDILIVKEKTYLDHPKPEDVYLLVEVSDSTLHKDKAKKLPLYASVSIPEVWIYNLIERQTEIYTQPENGSYQQQKIVELTATLAPIAFPEDARQWLGKGILELLDKYKPMLEDGEETE